MRLFASSRASPWPERPVSEANKRRGVRGGTAALRARQRARWRRWCWSSGPPSTPSWSPRASHRRTDPESALSTSTRLPQRPAPAARTTARDYASWPRETQGTPRLRETRGGSGIRESVRSGTSCYGLIRACGASRAMPLSGSNHGLIRGIDGSISQHHTACDLDLFGFLAAPTVGAVPPRRQPRRDPLRVRGCQAARHLADPSLVCADQLTPARQRRPPPSRT